MCPAHAGHSVGKNRAGASRTTGCVSAFAHTLSNPFFFESRKNASKTAKSSRFWAILSVFPPFSPHFWRFAAVLGRFPAQFGHGRLRRRHGASAPRVRTHRRGLRDVSRPCGAQRRKKSCWCVTHNRKRFGFRAHTFEPFFLRHVPRGRDRPRTPRRCVPTFENRQKCVAISQPAANNIFISAGEVSRSTCYAPRQCLFEHTSPPSWPPPPS